LDNRMAIIFIHGFMGCSAQFDELIEILGTKSVSFHKLVLPGHETDLSGFNKSRSRHWRQYVNESVEEICRSYDRVLIVGHSMGGLLAVNTSVSLPSDSQTRKKIIGIVAVSFPLALKFTFRCLKIRLGAIGKQKKNELAQITAARRFCGVSGINIFNSALLIPNSLGLLGLINRTRKILPDTTVPITVINSSDDEIVSCSTLKFVSRKLPEAKTFRLAESSHFWFPENELEKIAELIKEYL